MVSTAQPLAILELKRSKITTMATGTSEISTTVLRHPRTVSAQSPQVTTNIKHMAMELAMEELITPQSVNMTPIEEVLAVETLSSDLIHMLRALQDRQLPL